MGKAFDKPINIQPERLRNLLQDLIGIYSPSRKEEEVLKYPHKYLERHGLTAIKQEVDENRHNLHRSGKLRPTPKAFLTLASSCRHRRYIIAACRASFGGARHIAKRPGIHQVVIARRIRPGVGLAAASSPVRVRSGT